jgi:hypothetical protein
MTVAAGRDYLCGISQYRACHAVQAREMPEQKFTMGRWVAASRLQRVLAARWRVKRARRRAE